MDYRSFAIPCLLLLASALSSAQDTRRDGNWWNQQPLVARAIYLIGFGDGLELGKNFSVWDLVDSKNTSCATKAMQSFEQNKLRFLSHVKTDQVADGVTAFYSDYRNRSILIHEAVWIVLNSIAGTPQTEINKMIENARRNVNIN